MSAKPYGGTAALECRHLSAHYHTRAPKVIQDVSLRIPTARWTCIVGPNGAGKSSLLMALAGLMPNVCGQIDLFGRPITKWSRQERARTVAWLGQKPPQADDLLVIDVVGLGRIAHQNWMGAPSSKDIEAVAIAMDQTQCAAWRNHRFGDLSSGEQQRVLLARALAVQAPLVLMDEPLANLDPPHQVDWLHTVRQLVDQGSTVVSVLHELPIALQADELLIMAKSAVVHQGSASAAATRQALACVFEHRIRLCEVNGQWTSLPRLDLPQL